MVSMTTINCRNRYLQTLYSKANVAYMVERQKLVLQQNSVKNMPQQQIDTAFKI